VRVTDADGNKLGGVYLALFDDEASELNDALDYPGKVVRLLPGNRLHLAQARELT